jgi:hypothetical protein
MKYLLISILTIISLSAFAQQEKAIVKPKWQYTAILQGGLIGGSSELNYSVQTIQGIKRGPWTLGIGAGIDNYVMPGIPVVAHGQFNYGKRRSKPFVYAQGGPQIPWAKNQWDDKIWGSVNQYEMKTGWLAEGGIGYSFPMGKHLKLISSLGYSVKQAKYDEVQMPWSWLISSWRPTSGALMEPLNYYHQKLTMNRLVLKVGVQF